MLYMAGTLYACEYCGDVVDRAPLVLQDVKANLPIRVDVRVEHFRHEPYL